MYMYIITAAWRCRYSVAPLSAVRSSEDRREKRYIGDDDLCTKQLCGDLYLSVYCCGGLWVELVQAEIGSVLLGSRINLEETGAECILPVYLCR